MNSTPSFIIHRCYFIVFFRYDHPMPLRAGRTLSKIGCGVSLLLSALTCVLWVRSYWRNDTFDSGYFIRDRDVATCYYLTSERGRLVLSSQEIHWIGPDVRRDLGDPASRLPRGPSLRYSNTVYVSPTVGFLGFARWQSGFSTPQGDSTTLSKQFSGYAVPIWSLTGLLAVLPAICLPKAVRSRRRRRRGQCEACGYDLRASPLRCPECGTMREALEERG